LDIFIFESSGRFLSSSTSAMMPGDLGQLIRAQAVQSWVGHLPGSLAITTRVAKPRFKRERIYLIQAAKASPLRDQNDCVVRFSIKLLAQSGAVSAHSRWKRKVMAGRFPNVYRGFVVGAAEELTLEGAIFRADALDASTNLMEWQEVASEITDPTGLFRRADSQSANDPLQQDPGPLRFYRAREIVVNPETKK
jgi:hypothetical protein